MRRKVYIIRHGETEWNRQKRLQGQTDIELNEEGRRLACLAGASLREVPFKKIYSSPLKRAVETARLSVGPREIPIILDDRIQEISFGEWEGCQEKNDGLQLFFHQPEAYKAPAGGETIQELIGRTAMFLDDIRKEAEQLKEDDVILVSTHGAASRAMLSVVKGTEIKDFWDGGVPPNCSYSVIETDGKTWKLLKQDCRGWIGASEKP